MKLFILMCISILSFNCLAKPTPTPTPQVKHNQDLDKIKVTTSPSFPSKVMNPKKNQKDPSCPPGQYWHKPMNHCMPMPK